MGYVSIQLHLLLATFGVGPYLLRNRKSISTNKKWAINSSAFCTHTPAASWPSIIVEDSYYNRYWIIFLFLSFNLRFVAVEIFFGRVHFTIGNSDRKMWMAYWPRNFQIVFFGARCGRRVATQVKEKTFRRARNQQPISIVARTRSRRRWRTLN